MVWVGFDDNTDLSLEGAHSALPIWAEFMRQAHEQRAYRDPEEFEAPEGILTVEIDPDTQQLATYACPNRTSEAFITGTQPSGFCTLHGGGGRLTLSTSVSGWGNDSSDDEAEGDGSLARNRPAGGEAARSPGPQAVPVPGPQPAASSQEPKKKSGFFGRVLGIIKD